MSTMSRPLDGVVVVAVEQMIAGPWATQFLARLGADVMKIESPKGGDSGRASQPAVTDADGLKSGATFLRNNLNKRSVAIDLKKGVALVLELAKRCDVFVQNYKAGALDAMGLGYDAIAAVNPRAIYVSVSGFGTGPSPYRERPAYASVAEAMSGIYDWARQPGQRPVINPMGGLGDIGSGMFAALGILAALRQRDTTGVGQHVDIAMFDAMVAIADVVPSMWSLGARERAPGAILTTFEAADGAVVVQVSREHQFERLAECIGRPEWRSDERFATRAGWVTHLDDVIRPGIEAWMGGRAKNDVCEVLAAAGIPCAPVNNAEDVLSDPHLREHGMLIDLEAADGTHYVVPGNPVRLSGMEPVPPVAAPSLGAHTDEVLRTLAGLDAAAIDQLRRDGVIR